MELIFLGTGTSAGLPYIDCITAPPERDACRTCLSALTPEGKRNMRRNTSAVVRMDTREPGRKATIVIDAGKTFQASALEWFPKYGLREIDAILITHAHADALNGLDDLRSWTLYGLIQPRIDIYLSQETFDAVKTSFPYLVSKEYASGGGDVPEFNWHVISDQIAFEINTTGIFVTPFSVHHGFRPSTSPHMSPSFTLLDEAPSPVERRDPFLSFGFKISDEIIYISDASHIPAESWNVISPKASCHVPVCVLDCLQLQPHTSHFHFAQAISEARKIHATRTYLTGFCHAASHEEFISMGEIVGGAMKDQREVTALNAKGFSFVEREEPIWVRPAHDGLRVTVNNRMVCDETYLTQPPEGNPVKRGIRNWFVRLKSSLSWKRLASVF